MMERATDDQPLVSVFMPVYNQERFVAAALDSVLGQTYGNYEIVISDDCSQDLTPNIVSEYANQFPEKIKLYKLANINLGDNHFERLLEKCKGEYVCLFSGDDLMYPEKLFRQMDDILRFGLSFHGHAVDCIDASGMIFDEINIKQNRFITSTFGCVLFGVPTAGCSWLIERSYVKFNRSLGFLHDFDLAVSAMSKGKRSYLCTEKLGAYRITKTSWSNTLSWRAYVKYYPRLLTAWFKAGMFSECLWLLMRSVSRLSTWLFRISRTGQ